MIGKCNSRRVAIWTYEGPARWQRRDELAAEEPLEIRLEAGGLRHSLALTMRTPGHDFELAAGFLFSEGLIKSHRDIEAMTYCADAGTEQRYNLLNVCLRMPALPDLRRLDRYVSVSSACGVCGRASIEALACRAEPLPATGPLISPQLLTCLPEQLRAAQGLFARTGGLHATALFNLQGELLALREDVGRHNAFDKLIGQALLADRLPLQQSIALLSGRASFELLQKAAVAGIPIVCAVSAPSSLAVQTARSFNMTLVGFLRGERFNVYSGVERLAVEGR